MEINEIQKVADEWNKVTWVVIEFKDPGVDKIGKLFQKTCEIIEEYHKENLVPKEISSMLLEMYDFGRWVCDLHETPLHNRYQEIVSLIFDLNNCFLTGNYDFENIKDSIEELLYK